MSAKRFNQALAVLALVGIAANANAQSSVSVTGEFTRFTVDEGYLNLPTYVNGVQIDDGSRTTGITTAISGSSVTFDYDSLSHICPGDFTAKSSGYRRGHPESAIRHRKQAYPVGLFQTY